jgi:hypothetical protein
MLRVEVEGALGVADGEADVVDVLRDARGGEVFAGALGLDAGGLGLGEFEGGAVGVVDGEDEVAGAGAAGVGGDFDAFGGEVEAHCLEVVGEEADVA